MKFSIKFKSMTFKRKLFIYSLLLSIVPVFILGTISSYITSSSVKEEVERNHSIVLKQLEMQMDTFLKGLDKSSLRLINDPFVTQSLASGVSMDDLDTTLNMINRIFLSMADADVKFQVSLYFAKFNQLYTSEYGAIRELDEPYTDILKTLESRYNGSLIIPPNTYEQLTDLIFIRAIPLNASRPEGYLFLHLDQGQLLRYMDQLPLEGGRRIIIIDGEQRIMTSQDASEVGTQLTDSSQLYPYLKDPHKRGAINVNGESYHISTLKSAFNDWTYLAMTPAKELTYKSDKIKRITWIIMLCISLLWLVFVFIGTRQIYYPIQRLIGKFSPEDRGDGLKAIDNFMMGLQEKNKHLQVQLHEQKPFMKDSILQQLLHGGLSEGEVRKYITENELPLRGHWFCVAVVDIDQYSFFQQKYRDKDRSLMMYALRNMIEETTEEHSSLMSVTMKPGQVVLLIGFAEMTEQSAQWLVQMSHDIRGNIRTYFDFTVSVVISNARTEYASIHESYQEALGLLEYRWIVGPDRYITVDQIEPHLKQSTRDLVRWKTEIVSCISQGDFTQARMLLDKMAESIPKTLQHSEMIKGLFAYLLGEVDSYLNELGYELNDMFEFDVLSYLYQLSSLQEVQEWMSEALLGKIQDHLRTHSLSKQKKIIPQVLLYIQENYEQDLSLQMLSDEFNVSPSMLSRMFKEETNENYLDYIIRFRMDKAKEWLIHTELSIKDITDRLRYASVQNFTRIFKQVTGYPPGSFRKMHRAE